jgi:uncharacterized protein with GYD domain
MATYILLIKYTDQGVREVKQLASIRPELRALIEQLGGKMLSGYVTQGRYDGILTVDFPDDSAAAAFSVGLAARGRNRTETLRAYTLDEFQAILEKVPNP